MLELAEAQDRYLLPLANHLDREQEVESDQDAGDQGHGIVKFAGYDGAEHDEPDMYGKARTAHFFAFQHFEHSLSPLFVLVR